jgi:drug/metabolite transporter (DMT)-like permease
VSVKVRAYLSWVTICLVWGTTYLAIRVCLETLPPGLSAGLRWLTAGVLLVAFHLARRRPLPPRSAWPGLAVIGILFIVLGNGLVVWAEQWVPSGLTAVLLATTPFWMVGIELLLPRGERPDARTWAGLLVGFAGIVLLVWPELAAGVAGVLGAGGDQARQGGPDPRDFLLGVLALQAACIAWAGGSAYSRWRHQEHGALGGAALQMIVGGVLLTALGTASGEWPRVALGPRSAVAFTYLVVVGSIVAYSAYLYTLKHLPVSTISLYAYINPVIAMILGAIVLSEPLGARTAAASLVVLLGVALVSRSAPATSPSPAADAAGDGHSEAEIEAS